MMGGVVPVTLYLHGLGSSGRSTTAMALQAQGVRLLAPDYAPQHYRQSIDSLCRLVEGAEPGCIIGTSMGGYYALKLFERFALPTVAVNPCYTPSRLLRPYLEKPAWDYAVERPIYFSTPMLEAFEPVAVLDDSPGLRVVVGRNDDLIAPQGQRAFCIEHGIAFIETDWGHRVADVRQLLAVTEMVMSTQA